MKRQHLTLLLLPAVVLVLVVGTTTTAYMLRAHDEWVRAQEEAARQRGDTYEPDYEAINRNYNDALRPSNVALLVSIPLFLWSVIDLSRRWMAERLRPAWFTSNRTVVAWGAFVALALLFLTINSRMTRNAFPQMAAYEIVWPAVIAIVGYGCLFLGHRLTNDQPISGRLRLQVGLAWLLAAAFFWPLLSLLVLIPDPSSEDLLYFTLPATAFSAMTGLGLLAAATVPDENLVNPLGTLPEPPVAKNGNGNDLTPQA